MGEDLEKFIEKYPTYIEALDMLKQKDQRIAELEEENTKLKEQVGSFVFADSYDENNNPIHKQIFKTYKESCAELSQENCRLWHEIRKLQEQLRNAIIPKHKKGDSVFIIVDNRVVKGIVTCVTQICVNTCLRDFITKESVQVCYDVEFDDGKICPYWDVFDTKAEAQKYLEKRK